MIDIHPMARISHLSDIEDSMRGTRIAVGAYSSIDSFVKIKPGVGSGDVVIGEHVAVHSCCVLYAGNGIHIGNRVTIAANCTLAPLNHAFTERTRPVRGQGPPPSKGGIVIEDDVWVGANCVLLDGAVLRKGCVIGAGSLVRGEVAAGSVQGGRPLARIGQRP